jgi:hypothetical protein
MAKSLNIVIGADITKLREGFNKAVEIVQSGSNKMSAEVAKSAKSVEERLAAMATRNPTMGTVRQLTLLAMEARALGPEFANVANEIIKQAGKIKDSIADARGEVSYFASDTRRLDAVLGGVQALSGAFSSVQGAAVLLGDDSKALQETMLKLHAATSLVNGITAVQNAMQAESALMVGLNTAAVRIQTYVMGQATVAARIYAGALVATGAGAIIVAIGLVASAFSSVKDETKDATKAVNTLTEAYKKQAETSKNISKIGLEIADQLLKKELDAAKLRGASEKELTKIEIAFWQKRKENLQANLVNYDKYSAQYLQISRNIAEVEGKIDELQTNQSIENANNRREKKKKIQQKEFDDAIALIKAQGQATNDAERFFIDQNKKIREKAAAETLKSKQFSGANMIAGTAIPPVLIQVKIDPKSYSQIVQDFDKLMMDVTAAVEALGENVATAFGEAIGGAMSGQQDVLATFGDAVLTALGGFMAQVGKMLIAYAISIEKLQTAFANPTEALVAGIALVAIGSAIKNSMQKGPSVPAFADGGIVSGPTLGLMGEYPGASTNPEIIAPLDKLKGMLNTGDNTGYIASTQIQGRDLAIVLERYNKDSRRG